MASEKSTLKGFFDPDVAREAGRNLRAGLQLSATDLERAKALGIGAADRVKALYPPVENVGGVAPIAVAKIVGHSPETSEQERLWGGIVSEGDCGGHQPCFGQKRELQCDGINPVWQIGSCLLDHSSSPADVGAEQGKARAGAEEGAFALPRPDAPKPSNSTTWRTTMRKLWAVCRRLDDHWVGDLIGVVFLFGMIPIVLGLALIFGGAK